MRYTDYLNFSFFQIKEFLVLYETLNYTKAAQKCYVTQSTLSRNITSMENTLGIQLFIRNTVKVTPTPAAKSLYEKLRTNYVDYETAILNAYRIQECKMHPLMVGINDGMDIMPELLPFIRSFHKKHPDYEINFFRDFDFSLNKKLENHECDVILDFIGLERQTAELECFPLLRGPLVLYILEDNPLSKKAVLKVSDLLSQQMLIRSPSSGANQVEFLRQMFAEYNAEPSFSPFVANALDLSLNIHENNQAILADGYFIGRSAPYLVSRIVQGTESIVYLKWSSIGTEISNVQIFVKEMMQYFSEQL